MCTCTVFVDVLWSGLDPLDRVIMNSGDLAFRLFFSCRGERFGVDEELEVDEDFEDVDELAGVESIFLSFRCRGERFGVDEELEVDEHFEDVDGLDGVDSIFLSFRCCGERFSVDKELEVDEHFEDVEELDVVESVFSNFRFNLLTLSLSRSSFNLDSSSNNWSFSESII